MKGGVCLCCSAYGSGKRTMLSRGNLGGDMPVLSVPIRSRLLWRAGGAAGGTEGTEAGAESAAGDSPGAVGQYDYPGTGTESPPSGGAGEPFERDLGGDQWDAPSGGDAGGGGGGWGSFGGDDGGGGDGDGFAGGAMHFRGR